jgi:hypothetical protein
MSTINFQNLLLKQKQQQRHSKQNITISNLNGKMTQNKPNFRMIKPATISIINPTIVSVPTIVSTVSNVSNVSTVSNVSVSDSTVSVINPTIVDPISVINPTIVEQSDNINNNFTLKYIKGKIMNDYGNLYKTS